MKKIINGKKYDTDKAAEVGRWDNGMMPTDMDYIEQALHRKKNGEYFLYSEGGPRTRYARSEGYDRWSSGWAIEPVTYDEAREWAEAHLPADDYEDEFGVPDEDEYVAVTYRISRAAKRAVEVEAARTGESQAAIVERAIMAAVGA